MYSLYKRLALWFCKVPHDPEPPGGDEASLKVFRASPKYLSFRRIQWAIQTLFAFFFLAMITGGLVFASFEVRNDDELGPWIAAAMIAAAVVMVVLAAVRSALGLASINLDYDLRWYMVTDRSLRIREGVWNVREMTMTFANIQNVSINQGPLQRFFGIADLEVRTAGGGGFVPAEGQQAHGFGMHVGYFRGVDNAEAIRDLMMRRLKRYKDAGLGEQVVAPDGDGAHQAGLAEALEALKEEARAFRRAAEGQ